MIKKEEIQQTIILVKTLFNSIPSEERVFFSFIVFLMYIPLIVIRVINEEKVLEKELNGYLEYKKKVKYRIIPFIW